jgi:hypothetical protein
MNKRLVTLLAILCLISSLLLPLASLTARAAAPGLPFTEDFYDDSLRDGSHTTANWTSDMPGLLLATSDPRYGAFEADLVGMNITGDTHSTMAVAVNDLDGDGDADLVAGNYGQVNRLYLNNGSADPFGGVSGSDISSDTGNTASLALGDLDGDGDLDLVAGNINQPNRLYLNNGTADPFAGVTGMDISSDVRQTYAIALGDMDNDGDLDVVAGNDTSTNRLYLNNGSADPFNGVSGTNITSDTYQARAIAMADMDWDGDLDLVTGNSDQANRLYLNNGTADPFAGINGTNISSDVHNTNAIAIGDMNGDGYADVVAGNIGQTNRLYLNNTSPDPFNGVSGSDIGSESDESYAIALADVESDGDLDVVAGNYNQPHRLYLNDGSASPFSGPATRNVTSDLYLTRFILFADMDGDGDPDLLSGNWGQANRLYLNTGTLNLFNGAARTELPVVNTHAVVYGDVDGDGDLDLVTGNYHDNPHLFLNNGTSTPFSSVSAVDIGSDIRYTLSVALGDLDGDGDLDLVTGNDGQANRLYLNNGTIDPFGSVSGTDISSDTGDTNAIALGDLDRDGDLDLVAGNYGQTNRLYLNNGTGDPFLGVSGTDISSDPFNTRALALGDLDNDGDLDLVTGEMSQMNRVYLNNGTAAPFDSVSGLNAGSDFDSTTSLALGDLDGDSDLDLVVGNHNSFHPNRLYLNSGTMDPFNGVTGQTIGTESKQTEAVVLGDLDNDGDLDLVTGNDARVNRLYLNNGSTGPFDGVSAFEVSSDVATNTGLALADFDRNGSLDILAANSNTFSRLYQNRLSASPYRGVISSYLDNVNFQTRAVAIGDLNGDGAPDLVEGNMGNSRFFLNTGSIPNPFPNWSFFSMDSYFDSAVALGDVDRDGDLDVVMGSAGWAPRLFLNNGTDSPFSGYSYIGSVAFLRNNGIALGDMDGDGDLDVVLGNSNVDGDYNEIGEVNQLFLNNGTATPFSGVTPLAISSDVDITHDIAVGDVDRDGDLDVVAGNFNSPSRLYLNNGTADPFNDVDGLNVGDESRDTWGIALADLDGDGDLDVAAANDEQTNRLYLNNGSTNPFDSASRSDITADVGYSRDILPVDFNRDGHLDLLVGNYGQLNRVYLNNGSGDPFNGVDGFFVGGTEFATMSLAVADLDRDGDLDVVEGNEPNNQPNVVHMRNDLSSYDPARGLAASLRVDAEVRSIFGVTLTVAEAVIPNTAIRYYLSNNGGAKWYLVKPGVTFRFPTRGTDLRWKVELSSLTTNNSPWVQQIHIEGLEVEYLFIPQVMR